MTSSDSLSLAARAPVTLPGHLPDELKLNILGYLFDFLHDNRPLCGRAFLLYKKRPVDPILKWADWAHLIPEALHSQKKFALEVTYGGLADSGEIEQRIYYPTPHCAKFIKTVEIHFNRVEILQAGRTINMPGLIFHFLRKLEAGELGFNNLSLLRFVFKIEMAAGTSKTRCCDDIIEHFERIPPFNFQAERFEVEMEGHVCGQSCHLGPGGTMADICWMNERIMECHKVSKAGEAVED